MACDTKRRIERVVRRYVGYEPDYAPSDEQVLHALESMIEDALAWRAVRDEMRKQIAAIQSKAQGRRSLERLIQGREG